MAKSTSVSTVPTAALVDWDNKEMQLQIKETYGKNLQPAEWNLFMGLGKATGLNPFLREIWAVKYGSNPASVFVGRDGYRRSAQAHADYEYHYAMAVYANDEFSLKSGEPEHSFKPADRGALVGAYCVVKRKSSARAVTTWVDVKEYKQNGGVWATKPATMCTKVAEAQGLRASFQELFAGTYEESEDWKDNSVETDKGRFADAPAADKQKVRDAVAKDPMAPAPGQTDIVTEVMKKETVAEQSPPRARRGRPAKTTEAAVDTEGVPGVIDAEVVPPVPTSEVCKHLNIVTIKNEDGSQQCPICKKVLVEAGDWQQKPGSAFKNIMSQKPATKAAAAPEATAAPDLPPPPRSRVPEDEIIPGKIRTDQTRKLFAVWGEYKKTISMPEDQSAVNRKKLMKDMFGADSSTVLNEQQADELIGRIEGMTELAKDYTGGEPAGRAQGEAF